MKKIIKLHLVGSLFLSLCVTTVSYSLGLGDLDVFSKHGEPLRAQISFLNASEIERGKILVGLATSTDYQRARVQRTPEHSDLRFKLDYSSPQPKINVSTTAPFNLSYIKFLVQARWPQGKLLREYHIRFKRTQKDDYNNSASRLSSNNPEPYRRKSLPPPPDIKRFSLKNNANTPRSYTQPQDNRVLGRTNYQPSVVAPQATNSAPQLQQYRVKPGDTLWSIAVNVGRQLSVSPQQALLLLQNLNPHAFINGNINNLEKNAVLAFPAASNSVLPYPQSQMGALQQAPVIQIKTSHGRIGSGTDRELPGSKEFAKEIKLTSDLRTALSKTVDRLQQEIERSRLESSDFRSQFKGLREQIGTLEKVLGKNNKAINELTQVTKKSPMEGYINYIITTLVIMLVFLTVGSITYFISKLVRKKKNSDDIERVNVANFEQEQRNEVTDDQKKVEDSVNNNHVKSEVKGQKKPKWRKKDKTQRNIAETRVETNDHVPELGAAVEVEASQRSDMEHDDIPVMEVEVNQEESYDNHKYKRASNFVAPAENRQRLENDHPQSTAETSGVNLTRQAIDDTKDCFQLELAQTYIDLGDRDGAEELLNEVLEIGTPNQRRKAKLMLSRSSFD